MSSSLSSAGTSDNAEGTTSWQSDSGHSDTPASPFVKKKRPCLIDRKFQPEWSLKYKGIKQSNRGSTYAFCILCSVDISTAEGGVHQIKRHFVNKRHSNPIVELNSQPMIMDVAHTQSDARLSDKYAMRNSALQDLWLSTPCHFHSRPF